MTFGSTTLMVEAALQGGYAVPAVNVVDMFSMMGVVRAAEQEQAPIIIQTSVKTVKMIEAAALSGMFRQLAEDASVPVALHLDHCPDRAVISLAIESGWSSVLFDASDRDYDAALAETVDVVKEARAANVSVESEIENIAGVEDGVGAEVEGRYYESNRLIEFVGETECNLFAPALGTAHGQYSARPTLRFDRATELSRLLNLPLVLHGGTGLEAVEFEQFIRAGCAKINISTSLKLAYLKAIHEALNQAEAADKWDPPAVFNDGVAAVVSDVAQHIRLFGAAGKAA